MKEKSMHWLFLREENPQAGRFSRKRVLKVALEFHD
jgi:hypothetical protein